MNKLDYIVLISGVSVVICFFILLIRGKKITKNKSFRYYPLIMISSAISSSLILDYYSQNQLEIVVNRFNELINKSNVINYDTLSITENRKNEIVDSLKHLKNEYGEILSSIKKQEKIIGKKTIVVSSIESAIQKTKEEIYIIEKYNEIINDSVYEKKMKGYTISSSSNFIFQPPQNINGEYLDFIMKFQNEEILDDIVIYLCVHKKKKDGNLRHIFGAYYLPQSGVNAFRIPNYLKEKDTELNLGYFLKNEIGKKEYPKYEKIVYSLN